MTDLAALGLTVQSDGLLKATGTLDQFKAASDKASAGADKLSGQSGKLDGALRKLDATAGGVATEMQKLVNVTTGVSSATGGSIADQIRHGQALDDLRAKFNPLFAASRQYELQLREISSAEQLGAITAREAADARLRAANVMAPGPIDQYSRAMGGAAGATGNVFAQLNDIGVMMAAGQNPLQLALQQGTQLNQVWGQMGGKISSVGAVLRGAFVSMLNPLNLLTLGVIAGGAALVQWGVSALGAGSSTGDFALKAGEAQDAIDALNDSVYGIADGGLEALRAKYGEINLEVLNLVRNQQLLALADATKGVQSALDAISSELGDGFLNSADIELARIFNVSTDNARRLNDAIQGIGDLTSIDDQRSSIEALTGLLSQATNGFTNMTDEQAAMLGVLIGAEDKMRQLAAAQKNVETNAISANRAVNILYSGLTNATGEAVALASAAPGGGWMNAAIQGVNGLIGRLSAALGIKNALVDSNASAGYTSELDRTGQSSGPDSVRTRVQFDGGAFEAPVLGAGLASVDLNAGTGGGGGGGGGGAARVDEYTEAQKRALAVIADMNEAAVTQADVISALEVMHQSGAIGADQLATAIANVKEQMADVDKVSFSLSKSLSGVFTDALTGAKSLQDGIKDLLGSMAELFLNAAFQKFLPTLLPGIDFGGFRAAGGPVSGGRSYIVGENGPELFTPGRSGGITPNHAMGGAGTSVQINNYSGAPVREQRSRGPDGRELIKVIVGEELGTGGYDKQLRRYGATPAKVRR